MRARERLAWGLLIALALSGRPGAAQTPDRRQIERAEQQLREEGEAMVALADAAAQGRPVPDEIRLAWHNDFLKAQSGTFIPFIVTITPGDPDSRAALLLVRAARRRATDPGDGPSAGKRAPRGDIVVHPFEEIYPVVLSPERRQPVRFTRGFALAPGDYDLTVVVRQRDGDGNRGGRRRAGVLHRPLHVPNYSRPGLATSTVILADRLSVLPDPPPASTLHERPYVIGTREVEPASDPTFRRDEELIVVFLVYNPSLDAGKHFDVEVEYHFFRKTGERSGGSAPVAETARRPVGLPGERYFNRTEPQRFNPSVLGPQFDPAAGQPIMAGQGVPLAGFDEGDYRLVIKVTDLLSGRSLERAVGFSVGS